ncbi:TetR family transcriptional regulator [Conexibacter sp. W3-3-2]|uniref:TetR/AcrR family transcriptional regulator n=1 Tax=Conexibacter sp. W3-3-2 TaxID=2675227 RepID=UPI0012BA297A|nr:helix-turn-helix domain-containing protein [Conexibacter sp. W3-3-2]MTD43000.1 TetR family transcriptional regulator [Conexibacter sp. W3-3-2]
MDQKDIDALFDPDRTERLLFGKVLDKPRDRRARRAARVTGAQRRVQILEAVIPVFAARGYARATLRRLEAVSPVSRPTMYSYFPSKAHLYAAALRHEAQRVEAVLGPQLVGAHAHEFLGPAVLAAGRGGHVGAVDTVAAGPAPTGWELEPLPRVVCALVRWARRNPDSARLLLHRPIEEEAVMAVHAEVRRTVLDRVVAALRRDRSVRAQRGLNRRFALELHAEMLVGAAEAVMHWALAHPLVAASNLARAWTRPPRADLRRGERTPPGADPSWPARPRGGDLGRDPPDLRPG